MSSGTATTTRETSALIASRTCACARSSRRGPREIGLTEVGPERVGEVELGVGRLPEQEIADAELAGGAHDQVGIRQAGSVERVPTADSSTACGRPGPRPEPRTARRSLAPAVVDGDAQMSRVLSRGALAPCPASARAGWGTVAAADEVHLYAVPCSSGNARVMVSPKSRIRAVTSPPAAASSRC